MTLENYIKADTRFASKTRLYCVFIPSDSATSPAKSIISTSQDGSGDGVGAIDNFTEDAYNSISMFTLISHNIILPFLVPPGYFFVSFMERVKSRYKNSYIFCSPLSQAECLSRIDPEMKIDDINCYNTYYFNPLHEGFFIESVARGIYM